MVYPVVSIRDRKTGFMTPTMDSNIPAAIRNFCHAVQHSRDSVLYTHSQDFSLYHIADFDSDTGIVSPHIPIVFLYEAHDAVLESQRGDQDA